MPVSAEYVIRRGDVLWRATLDGVLVRVPGGDDVVKLAGTGAALWAELDEPIRFHAVCAALARTHDANAERIASDLAPVIDELADKAVVQIDR